VQTASTLYDDLAVSPDADVDTIKQAYRTQAKLAHPDRSGVGDATERMARVNHAWAVLSDPGRRAVYDHSLTPARPASVLHRTTPTDHAATSGRSTGARKDAWFAGLRVQVVRLTAQAGRSAALALSLKRRGRLRAAYEAELDAIIAHVSQDIPERVRHARTAGAAPLDLALASALVGLANMAHHLSRHSLAIEIPPRIVIQAQLIDRMWDTLAHELAHEVEVALGGNPHVARTLLLG
jgi:curved DNA-binding protein CbpA